MKKNFPIRHHRNDQLVESRKRKVRITNEDGTTTVTVLDVAYKNPRYERYEPFQTRGKTYPFGSTRQGFEAPVVIKELEL